MPGKLQAAELPHAEPGAPISHGSQGKGEVTMLALAFLTALILSLAAAANSHQLPHLASLHRAKEGIPSKPGTSQNVHLAALLRAKCER